MPGHRPQHTGGQCGMPLGGGKVRMTPEEKFAIDIQKGLAEYLSTLLGDAVTADIITPAQRDAILRLPSAPQVLAE